VINEPARARPDQAKPSGEKQPTEEDESQLHHAAHDNCFIANSVKTEIKVEPAK
jgi:organic hydroperoxide reductase OsmC/OhrA